MIFFDFGAFDFGGGRRLGTEHVMLTKVVTLSALTFENGSFVCEDPNFKTNQMSTVRIHIIHCVLES